MMGHLLDELEQLEWECRRIGKGRNANGHEGYEVVESHNHSRPEETWPVDDLYLFL